MKLVEYTVFGDCNQYRTIKFETEAGYKIEVTLYEDGKHNIECESAMKIEVIEKELEELK